MSVRAVIFDLDDTLLDRLATFEKYVPLFAQRFREHLEPCDLVQLRRIILEADGRGYRPREEMAEFLRDNLNWRSTPGVVMLVDAYREDFLACACASEGMLEVIGAIRARGIKTGIITNGLSRVQRRKIGKLGLEAVMDAIVVSEEAGIKKPEAAIYQMALKALGADA